MLDKSILFFNVIMKRSAGIPAPIDLLPNGFSFVRFAEGKEQRWAEIEIANIEYVLIYFRQKYMPLLDD
ncbi:hypothetical protein J6TS2_52310 [Heyndrickxia sporothermodurans]|nr:hypothetical protein J6TS2_52310 [Heyndrickxia sporothermodurans]